MYDPNFESPSEREERKAAQAQARFERDDDRDFEGMIEARYADADDRAWDAAWERAAWGA